MKLLEDYRADLEEQLQQAVGEHQGQLILLRLEEYLEMWLRERVAGEALRRG